MASTQFSRAKTFLVFGTVLFFFAAGSFQMKLKPKIQKLTSMVQQFGPETEQQYIRQREGLFSVHALEETMTLFQQQLQNWSAQISRVFEPFRLKNRVTKRKMAQSILTPIGFIAVAIPLGTIAWAAEFQLALLYLVVSYGPGFATGAVFYMLTSLVAYLLLLAGMSVLAGCFVLAVLSILAAKGSAFTMPKVSRAVN